MRELNSKLSFPYLLSCKTMRLNLNLNYNLLNFNRKEKKLKEKNLDTS
jgi:hypothetical protein